MPERPNLVRSTARASSTSPACDGATKMMSTAAATVVGPRLLQAHANAVSATANTKAPWVMSWPLTMSARTVILAVAAPSPTWVTSMPSAREAASPASIRATGSVTALPWLLGCPGLAFNDLRARQEERDREDEYDSRAGAELDQRLRDRVSLDRSACREGEAGRYREDVSHRRDDSDDEEWTERELPSLEMGEDSPKDVEENDHHQHTVHGADEGLRIVARRVEKVDEAAHQHHPGKDQQHERDRVLEQVDERTHRGAPPDFPPRPDRPDLVRASTVLRRPAMARAWLIGHGANECNPPPRPAVRVTPPGAGPRESS